jgi:hypothetical protein
VKGIELEPAQHKERSEHRNEEVVADRSSIEHLELRLRIIDLTVLLVFVNANSRQMMTVIADQLMTLDQQNCHRSGGKFDLACDSCHRLVSFRHIRPFCSCT